MPGGSGSWTSPTQLAPFGRVCIKRSGREQGGVAQNPKPRDSMQDSQMFKCGGTCEKSGDDCQPAQFRGGACDGPPPSKCTGEPKEWSSNN